jgi:hypothetical protein
MDKNADAMRKVTCRDGGRWSVVVVVVVGG